MMDGMGMMTWHMLESFLGLVLIFLMLVAAIAAVRWMLWNNDVPSAVRESAQSILKERYAKGEIGKEEFERIKKDIE